MKTRYRLGIVDSAPKILSCDLAEFAQESGENCAISLVEGTPRELLARLKSHEIEILLTNNISIIGKEDLIVKSIGISQISVYGSSKFSSLCADFPSSLHSQPLILPTRHSKLRYDLEHYLLNLKIKYDLTAEVQDSSVKKMMAEHGMGLVFLPEFAGDTMVEQKKLIKIGVLDSIKEEYWLLTRKRTIQSTITERILAEFIIR
jgi:LysR family transcriptional activator of nhaA